jgi:hypothetical protein
MKIELSINVRLNIPHKKKERRVGNPIIRPYHPWQKKIIIKLMYRKSYLELGLTIFMYCSPYIT